MIRWASLPASGLKLNTNVAFREKHGFIKTGAVTRNEWGAVLATQSKKAMGFYDLEVRRQ